MKTLLFLLSVLFATTCCSQVKDSNRRAGGKLKILRDTQTLQRIQQLKDSVLEQVGQPDTAAIREQVTRDTDTILEFQKEQRARERRGAFIRIAIGVLLLGILIFGFVRRRRSK